MKEEIIGTVCLHLPFCNRELACKVSVPRSLASALCVFDKASPLQGRVTKVRICVITGAGEERLSVKGLSLSECDVPPRPRIACSHFEQVMHESIFNQYERVKQANTTPAGGRQ